MRVNTASLWQTESGLKWAAVPLKYVAGQDGLESLCQCGDDAGIQCRCHVDVDTILSHGDSLAIVSWPTDMPYGQYIIVETDGRIGTPEGCDIAGALVDQVAYHLAESGYHQYNGRTHLLNAWWKAFDESAARVVTIGDSQVSVERWTLDDSDPDRLGEYLSGYHADDAEAINLALSIVTMRDWESDADSLASD